MFSYSEGIEEEMLPEDDMLFSINSSNGINLGFEDPFPFPLPVRTTAQIIAKI